MKPKKKKIFLYSLFALFVLLIVSVVSTALMIDSLIKKTVESAGPRMTGTSFTLNGVDIRLLSGSGRLSGLRIGNPEGYMAEFAMKIDTALLDVHPGTLLNEKLVIDSIQVLGPEISFEGGRSTNNLKDIGKNIARFVGSREEREKLDRKLQVNHFLLQDAKVHLRLNIFGKKEFTLNAPRIELRDLGTGPEGLTSAELTDLIVKEISNRIGTMATTALADLGTADAGDLGK